LFRFKSFVAGTTFGVEELKQAPQRVRIGRISEKRALAAHLHKSLTPKLVEMMGES
jgi:hypothetical protein